MNENLKAQVGAGRELGASDEVEPIASPADPLGGADDDEASLIGGDPTRQTSQE